ncbi:MAG TPA: hypothetical protein VN802_21970 [Stellaceae bacterium]|nr:hypothetical protein [Stellaceae bacterium]
MAEATEISGQQRDRSPAFPIIPLQTALERLAQFEAHFKRSPARAEKVGDAWNIGTKAYVDRIAAALRYYGLLEYQGAGKDRHVVVSEEGRKYLKAQQEETKREVIRAVALRPKAIAKAWGEWGTDRPADAACIDQLVQKDGFSVAGARDFLKVYDATITFSGLSESDKFSPEDQNGDEADEGARAEDEKRRTPPPPSLPGKDKVRLMEGERIVYTEEGAPNQYLKLVASGDVDDFLLGALEDYVKRQRKIRALLKRPSGEAKKPDWADKTFAPGDIVPGSTPFRVQHVGHAGEGLIEPDEGDAFPPCDKCGDKVRYMLA